MNKKLYGNKAYLKLFCTNPSDIKLKAYKAAKSQAKLSSSFVSSK